MDEKKTLDEKIGEVKDKGKRRLGAARLVMLILIICAFAFMFTEYGCAKIPTVNDAMAPAFPGGRAVMYDRLFRYHDGAWPACGRPNANLKRKFIVLFNKRIGTGTTELVSRIAALSGDEVSFRGGKIYVKSAACEKGGKREEISVGAFDPGAIPEGRVPDFRFVLLNDNVMSAVPDSRVFGYVHADEITGRVITLLPAWLR